MPSPRRIPPVRPTPGSGEDVGGPSSRPRESDPLGKILLASGLITREKLDAALAAQRKSFLPLGQILRTDAGLSAEALAGALKQQTHAPRIYLRFIPIGKDVLGLLDADFCRQHEVVAFERLGTLLCVALSNPAQRNVVRHIETSTGQDVKVFQAPWEDIQRKLGK
jgi:type IV pilus assembly protein PilB